MKESDFKMFERILDFLKKHAVMSMIASAIIGALISWTFSWILPSNAVQVSNLPKKELTCTLDFSLCMISKRVSDDRLQISYDGQLISEPYLFNITIQNSGDYTVSNEDFKDAFSIDFLGCESIVSARVVKSAHQSITEEVLSNAEFNGTHFEIENFFLNPDEYFTICVITDGNPHEISYKSRISDVSNLVLRNTSTEAREKGTFLLLTIFFIILVVAIILFASVVHIEARHQKMMEELRQEFLRNPVNDSINRVQTDESTPL